jgi:Tfp pilus assembly protein PilX
MKTSAPTNKHEQGHVLLVTIVITSLITFLLATYLTLVNSQVGANARSQSWNSAMPIVEAGIEDALAHLNSHGVKDEDLACEGWTRTGDKYAVTRNLGNSMYSVTISNYVAGSFTQTPVVESRGYVLMPTILTSAQSALLASAVSQNTTINYLGRGVRVQTRKDAIFVKGLVAKDYIDMNGNGVETDSFDSTDPLFSTNGLWIASKAKDNGDVAVNSSITNSLNVGNANIKGHVSVGPGGTISVGSQGAIGSDDWHNGGNKGIEPGWSANDMNVTFDDVEVPFSGGLTPSGGWITNSTTTYSTNVGNVTTIAYPAGVLVPITTNMATSQVYPIGSPGPVTTSTQGKKTYYTYPTYSYSTTSVATNTSVTSTYYDCILDDGDYQQASLTGSVYVRGKARLYVTTTLAISALVIQSGKSLNLYSGAATVGLSGNNSANSDGTADSFAFWGLPSCTSIAFSGNAGFTGTIYAPNADFKLNGGGNNTTDFVGASITKTVTLNGHFHFHYDEALRNLGPSRGFIVNSWSEMLPSEVPKITLSAAGQ